MFIIKRTGLYTMITACVYTQNLSAKSLFEAISIATQQAVVKSQLGVDWEPVIQDNFFIIGSNNQETVHATDALTYPRIQVESGSTFALTLNPDSEKTFNLQGEGTFILAGGGTVHATGSSPDLTIENGTFNINGAYGANGAVNTSIHRDGTVNVTSDASLNAKSLTYYLGDGNTNLSSPDPLKTGTLNLLSGANQSTLPNTITVNKDTTVSDNDIVEKLHTLAPGKTIATLITGVDSINNGVYIPTLTEDITSDLFDFGLSQSGNKLNLIMQRNGTQEYLAILAAAELHVADSMVKSGASGIDKDDKPDPSAFHAKSLQLMQHAKAFFSSLKKKCIDMVHLSHVKQNGSINGTYDTTPLVIPIKQSEYSLFLSPIYGQAKTRATALMAGSSAHQLGLLGGIEKRNVKNKQFLSIQGAVLVGHSLVNSGYRSSSFSKTGLLGVFFSQEFLQEAEWNTLANAAFTYGHSNRFTANEMYQSRPKSRVYNLSSELAYKFKYYGGTHDKNTLSSSSQDKSVLSFRPLVGLKYSHVESSAHTEKRTIGQGVGLTTLADQYNLVEAFTSLGIRRRFLLDNEISLKLTGIAEYHRTVHRPSSMCKKMQLATAATPISFKINEYPLHRYIGSLTGSISQNNNNWKAFLKASFIKNGPSTTHQLMITINRKF